MWPGKGMSARQMPQYPQRLLLAIDKNCTNS